MNMRQNPYETPRSNMAGTDTMVETEQLQKIALGQKLVIYAIAAYFILTIINKVLLGSSTETPIGVLGSILLVLCIFTILAISLWGVILLVTNMNYHILIKILAIILMFVPLINWIVLIIVNTQASKVLRAGGYKVGFFGAKPQ